MSIIYGLYLEINHKEIDRPEETIMNDDDETGDDHDEFQKDSKNDNSVKRKQQPRWPTRVFAVQCICRIISTCFKECDNAPHFNLSLAKELSFTNNKGRIKGFFILFFLLNAG